MKSNQLEVLAFACALSFTIISVTFADLNKLKIGPNGLIQILYQNGEPYAEIYPQKNTDTVLLVFKDDQGKPYLVDTKYLKDFTPEGQRFITKILTQAKSATKQFVAYGTPEHRKFIADEILIGKWRAIHAPWKDWRPKIAANPAVIKVEPTQVVAKSPTNTTPVWCIKDMLVGDSDKLAKNGKNTDMTASNCQQAIADTFFKFKCNLNEEKVNCGNGVIESSPPSHMVCSIPNDSNCSNFQILSNQKQADRKSCPKNSYVRTIYWNKRTYMGFCQKSDDAAIANIKTYKSDPKDLAGTGE